MRGSRSRKWIVVVVAAGLLGGGPPAQAAKATGPVALPPSPPGASERVVTLATGDRVLVRPGEPLSSGMRIEPEPGRPPSPVLRYLSRTHAYVLPMDATAAEVADPSRFDVAALLSGAAGHVRRPAVAGQATVDLTVRAVDRTGAPAALQAFVVELDTGEVTVPEPGAGGFTVQIPVGRYAVWAGILTDATATVPASVTLAVVPELRLSRVTTVRLDARTGMPVREVVDRADAIRSGGESVGAYQTVAGQTQVVVADGGPDDVFVLPMPTTAPGLGFFHRQTLVEPAVRLAVVGGLTGPVPMAYGNPDFTPHLVGDVDLPAVDGGAGTEADLSGVDVRGRLVLLTLRPEETDDLAVRVTRIAAAGGRAVLLVSPSRPFPGEPLAVPVVVPVDGSATKLIEGVRAGSALIRWHGSPGSSYQYNLMLARTGPVRADPTFRVRDRDLATVRTVYAAQAVGRAIASTATVAASDVFQDVVRFTMPVVRDEYYSTDAIPGTSAPVGWLTIMRNEGSWDSSRPWGGGQLADRGPYLAGRAYSERLNVGPFGPCVLANRGRAPASWLDGLLFVGMPVGCAGDPPMPDGGSGAFQGELIGTMVVRRDGVELGRGNDPDGGLFPATAAGGDYEIEVEARRTAPWTALNIRQSTTWQFPWADPRAAPPMAAVRFVTTLDEHNRAPLAGHCLTVWVERTTTVEAITSVHIEVSYDDGTTWTVLPLARNGDRWTAMPHPPAGATFVSLRARATDSAGGSVTQEVIRAYALV